MYGISDLDLQEICRIFKSHAEIKRVRIFGSRAKGTFSSGSDVDLSLEGNIPLQLLRQISAELNQESNLPFRFDLVKYEAIESNDLREHIDRVGITLVERA